MNIILRLKILNLFRSHENSDVIAGSVAQFQCRAVNRYYGGDHIIFLGAVEAYSYNGQEPLLFARGGFGKFIPDGK